MSADTHATMGRKLAQTLYDLLTHPNVGNDWEERARIVLNLRPPPDGYLPLIYAYAGPKPLFGGLTREEASIRLRSTRRWKRHFPDPTIADAINTLFNRRARAFLSRYPARTMADLAKQVTAKDLLAEPGISHVTVHEVRVLLHKYGYELRDF